MDRAAAAAETSREDQSSCQACSRRAGESSAERPARLQAQGRAAVLRLPQRAIGQLCGWSGRLSDRAAGGRVLAVSGPGMIHATAGLANAWANCWPMLLLGGANDTFQDGRGAFQEAPQIEAARPFVKYAARPESAQRLPFFVEQAVRSTIYGRPRCRLSGSAQRCAARPGLQQRGGCGRALSGSAPARSRAFGRGRRITRHCSRPSVRWSSSARVPPTRAPSRRCVGSSRRRSYRSCRRRWAKACSTTATPCRWHRHGHSRSAMPMSCC